MSSILFVDYQTVIPASWLNAINDMAYTGNVPATTFTLTNLVVNASVSGSGMIAYMSSPPAIGNMLPNTGSFTVVTASSQFNGPGTGLTGTAPLLSIGGTAANISGVVTTAHGGTGLSSLPANALLVGNGTGNIQSISAGIAGNILVDTGTVWASQPIPSAFDSGTVMLFQQTSAPTGWTKLTTHNNKALRVVSGAVSTGGSVPFTTAFASGLSAAATTLSIAQIPSHTHGYTGPFSPLNYGGTYGDYGNPASSTTGATGGGGSHAHSLPSFEVQYVDIILASKN